MEKDQWKKKKSRNALLEQELITACALESIAVFNNTDLKKKRKKENSLSFGVNVLLIDDPLDVGQTLLRERRKASGALVRLSR